MSSPSCNSSTRTAHPPTDRDGNRISITKGIDGTDHLSGQLDDEEGLTLNGATVRPTAIETLLCDPDFYTIIVDSLGVPVDMGHVIRLATTAQRSRSSRPPRSLVPHEPLG